MKTNRILSIVLSVVMVLTIVFSTGVFAEETEVAVVEPVVEEVVVVIEEEEAAPQEDEPVVDDEGEQEAPAPEEEEEVPETSEEEEEVPETSEEPAFEEGYVRVNRGASVYAEESRKNVIGSFDCEAVVYADVTMRTEDKANSWLQITFDTAEAREADEALLSGYVQFKDVEVLSDEEVAELVEALKDDDTVRSEGDKLIPTVDFTAADAESAEREEVVEIDSANAGNPATIVKQPVNCPAAVGATATFTVSATGVASYQWQWKPSTGTTWASTTVDGNKTAKITVEATDARYAYEYRCKLTGEDGVAVYTNVVQITKPTALKINTQPVNCAAAVGATATFSVSATGVASYQWQWKPATGTSWTSTTVGGNKTAKITVEATEARYAYEYRCKLTGEDGKVVYTNAVKITKPAALKINTQPVNCAAAVGATATFTVAATGVASYQWQWKYQTGTSWASTTATGNKTATMRVEATEARYAYEYRCKLTGEDGTVVYTNAVKITKPAALKINTQPVNCAAAVGATATFTVAATGVASYQWQWKYQTGTSWGSTTATGNKTATMRVEATEARYAYEYRCKLTGEDGTVVYTNAVKITKPVALKINTQPVNCAAAVGTTATFTVAATGVASYQWQWKYQTGTSWGSTTATGNKTATMRVEATEARYAYEYRCKLTGEDGTVVYTNAVKITKPEALKINTQPVDFEAAVGTTATFTVAATGVASYQWQWKYQTGTSWGSTTATGNKTATMRVEATEARYAYEYRCKLTGNDGTVVYTNAVQIVKPEAFAIVSQPVNVEAAVGETATFTVEATGVASYQWQWKYQTGTSWGSTTAEGNKTATINVEATEARYAYEYRCKLTGRDGSVLYTDAVRIVKPVAFEIVTQPVNFEAAVGETATFTVEATGVASYQWQWKYQTGTSWASTTAEGNKTATINVEATQARYAYEYRCMLTGTDGSVLYTDAVQITNPYIIIANVTYKPLTTTTCSVADYTGTETALTIPATVEGMTVVEVGEEAFMGNTTLVSIDLPDTITVIRARAFKNCSKLSEMK